jgi:hypothetical protein
LTFHLLCRKGALAGQQNLQGWFGLLLLPQQLRAGAALSGDDMPSALWSPVWVFQTLDRTRCTGVCGAEPVRKAALKERLDECLRLSSPSFAATTLGL